MSDNRETTIFDAQRIHDTALPLLTPYAIRIRQGGNAVVVEDDGTIREGPVYMNDEIIPNEDEFHGESAGEDEVQEAASVLRRIAEHGHKRFIVTDLHEHPEMPYVEIWRHAETEANRRKYEEAAPGETFTVGKGHSQLDVRRVDHPNGSCPRCGSQDCGRLDALIPEVEDRTRRYVVIEDGSRSIDVYRRLHTVADYLDLDDSERSEVERLDVGQATEFEPFYRVIRAE